MGFVSELYLSNEGGSQPVWESAEEQISHRGSKKIMRSLDARGRVISELPTVYADVCSFPTIAVEWNVMASSSDSEDDSFMAVDQEETVLEGTMEQDEEPHPVLEVEETRHNRPMSELPEEVLEYILSFLSPYQEHKTAALVCKQWYRLIKGTVQSGELIYLLKLVFMVYF